MGSRSRSTSPSSARPTIPGSRSIRNGSTGGPTARSSTPRTRRRSTRTSSTSTSTAARFPALWYALRDVVLFWVEHGVRIFRVDNPHTKPFPFWEWMIGEVQDRYPDAIFLAEAFTRPKVMKRLAKVGFTQSYTYFTWRNTKAELTEYLTELTEDRARGVHAAELLRQHARHQPGVPADQRPRRASGSAAVLAATLSPASTASTAASSCARRTPVPGQGGVSRFARSTRSRPGTGTGRATSGPTSRDEPAPPRAPALQASRQPDASTTPGTTRSCTTAR